MASADALPPGPVRESALGEFAAAWTEHDDSQIQAALARLPQDAGKSAAVEGFARAIFDTDPDASLRTLRAFPGEANRIARLTRVYSHWEQSNSASARDWLTNVPLTPAERTALQQQP